jgi:RNA polymerase sigma factor (sigma-70 family)
MEATSLPRRAALTIPRPLLARAGDERLVEQLRRGNGAAFEVIYDRYHAGLLSFCRHMLGSREEAEDALQHALIAAHEDILRSTKPIRLKAWLYTIARNRCLSVLRARREQPSDDIEISTAGLADSVQQRADVRELLTDLGGLPDDQRAALVLSEVGDLSHAEVAQVIGCEVSKVKSLVFQARSALIERRQARDIPCNEIREQLATLTGGALRRGHLRHHLAACEGCREFRDEVRRQRKVLAAALPVIPTLGFKNTALAAVGSGGGGGAAIAGGATGGGGIFALAGGGAAKVAVIVAVAAGAATGGSVATGSGVPFLGSGDESSAGSHQAEGSATPGTAGPSKSADKTERSAHSNKKGFDRVRGESNGARAREFAKTRGKGKKKGLYKERPATGRAKARAERAHPVRPAPKARSKPQTSTREAPGKPAAPAKPAKPVVTAPPAPPVVEEVAPPPPPLDVAPGSGGKGGGGSIKKTS